jgi:segregation and condensation protein A
MLEFTEEEEEEIRDLEQQLAEYKKFKETAKKLAGVYDSTLRNFTREGFFGLRTIFCPPEKVAASDLAKTFSRILGEIPLVEKLEEEMVKEVLRLEDKITHLQEYLKEKIQSSFSEVVSSVKDKIEVVVSFLAMLELVKQRVIHVEQKGLFSEIHLKHKENVVIDDASR